MDEIDLLKYLRIILAIATIVFFSPFFLFLGEGEEDLIIFLKIFAVLELFMIIPYLVFKIKLKSHFSMSSKFKKNIARDIIEMYPPTIYSFLYNKKIESYTDYTATILNLEQKGYIKVKSNNGEYDISILNSKTDGLTQHEKYTMDVIQKKQEFYKYDFEKKVLEDLFRFNLVWKTKKYEKQISVLVIAVIFISIIIISDKITGIILMVSGIIISIAMVNAFYSEITDNLIYGEKIKIKFTKLGKKVQKEVYGLKNYIKEYTLLSERSIEYKELFDRYIAYAICLGESKTVEKFVSENEQYRNLIYNKRK